MRELFHEAIEVNDGPTVVRFPKGNLLDDIEAVDQLADGVDIIHYNDYVELATSALIKPRSKSEWITPAASGAFAPMRTVHALTSIGPAVK